MTQGISGHQGLKCSFDTAMVCAAKGQGLQHVYRRVCVVLDKIRITRTVHLLVKCKSPGDLLKLSAIELQYSLKLLNTSMFWEVLLSSGIMRYIKQ